MTPPPRPRHPDVAQGRRGWPLPGCRPSQPRCPRPRAALSPSPWGRRVPRCWRRARSPPSSGAGAAREPPGKGQCSVATSKASAVPPAPRGRPGAKRPARQALTLLCHPRVQGTTQGQQDCGSTAQGRGNGRGSLRARQNQGFKRLSLQSGFPLAAAGPRSLASPMWGSRCHRRPPASHLGGRRGRARCHFHTWASQFPSAPGGGGGMRGGRLRRPLVGEATRELWHAAVPRGDSGFFQTGSEGHYGIAAPGRPRAEAALGLASWCRPPTACPLSPCRVSVTHVSCLPPRPRARRGLRPAAGGGGAPRHPVLQHGHGAAGLRQQQLPAQRQ